MFLKVYFLVWNMLSDEAALYKTRPLCTTSGNAHTFTIAHTTERQQRSEKNINKNRRACQYFIGLCMKSL